MKSRHPGGDGRSEEEKWTIPISYISYAFLSNANEGKMVTPTDIIAGSGFIWIFQLFLKKIQNRQKSWLYGLGLWEKV